MPPMPLHKIDKVSPIVFQISVQGALRKDWQDWFNGTLIATEGLSKGGVSTTFRCKVRDQAELIGILNWLHEMNIVIEKVNKLSMRMDEVDDQKID